MRWTKRKYKLKEKVKEARIVTRFLFLPKTLKFETRWLEICSIEQIVEKVKGKYKWKSIKFI